MGAFWEPGEVIFLCFFGCVFWTTPGATQDHQSGAPGVHSTDRGSKPEDNFGGLGRCGGVGGVQPNNQNPQSWDDGKSAISASEVAMHKRSCLRGEVGGDGGTASRISPAPSQGMQAEKLVKTWFLPGDFHLR